MAASRPLGVPLTIVAAGGSDRHPGSSHLLFRSTTRWRWLSAGLSLHIAFATFRQVHRQPPSSWSRALSRAKHAKEAASQRGSSEEPCACRHHFCTGLCLRAVTSNISFSALCSWPEDVKRWGVGGVLRKMSTWRDAIHFLVKLAPFYGHAACWLLPPPHHCFITFTCGWRLLFSFPPVEGDRFKPKLFNSAQHDNIKMKTSCLKTVQSASTHRCADGGGEVSESTKHFWSLLDKQSCSLHTYLCGLISSVSPRPREEGNSSKLQMSFRFMDTLPVGSSSSSLLHHFHLWLTTPFLLPTSRWRQIH